MRTLVGELVRKNARPTVVDMEAGLEHLSRGTARHADVALLVVEPYFKSMETGARMNALARELGIARVFALANKVRDKEDLVAVERFCSSRQMEVLGWIPYDDSLLDAERAVQSPLDFAPHSPAMKAIAEIARKLAEMETPLT